MCGRFALTAPASRIQAVFGLPALPDLLPRFNVGPGTRVAGVLTDVYGPRLEWFRWGLVPAWAKDPKIGYRAINARAETVAEKPMFRSAFKRRHCLVPITGFYEWTKQGRVAQPWHIRAPDGDVLALAGLWETWRDPETQEDMRTVTLVTTTPNETMAPIHDRMPVILPSEAWPAWLDTDNTAPEAHLALLRPYEGALVASPVDPWVNKVGNEGPRCQAPPGAPEETE